MNVRQLIENLSKVDPESEVMVEAPLSCVRIPIPALPDVILPTRCLRTGTFPATGKPWVVVQGTDTWGLDHGVESR